jgi:hypothetical protein
MKIEYYCGAIETENGLSYVVPFYAAYTVPFLSRLFGPFTFRIGEKKARELVKDLNDNANQYKLEALYLDKLRVHKCGVVGFSKDKDAKLELPEKKLEDLIEMLDKDVVRTATGPDMPSRWKIKFQGSAIIHEPRYTK